MTFPRNEHGLAPTILVYGFPTKNQDLNFFSQDLGWGISSDNGRARDPVFTIYENLARADAIIAFPNAHPVHLATLIAEAEVGHPFILNEELKGNRDFPIKPIVFCGDAQEWLPFKNMFSGMRNEGLLRPVFDRVVKYEDTIDLALKFIKSNLPKEIPLTRAHFFNYAQKRPDVKIVKRNGAGNPAPITVAFFGSASTKNPIHLQRCDEAVKCCSQNRFNILHGGGDFGVMKRLTDEGRKQNVFVIGVTVDDEGAPKLFFERKAIDSNDQQVDLLIASKDMLHRIETYAGKSHAFVALDGGIGTAQEIIVVAELLSKRHPCMTYTTVDQQLANKPLIVLNGNGIYTPILNYLELCQLPHLKSNITEVKSVEELQHKLQAHFRQFKPSEKSVEESEDFRSVTYKSDLLPMYSLPKTAND